MKFCNLLYFDISKHTELSYKPKNDLIIAENKALVHVLYPIEILISSKSNDLL